MSDITFQELRALSSLITSSLDSIESTLRSRGQHFPSPSQPFTLETEAPRNAPDVMISCQILSAAATQLIAAVRPPGLTAIITATQYHISSCLHTAIRLHVPEILREAGPQGLHVKDIAAPTQVDSAKLARILRLLVTNHIFVEVAPDIFAHNRMSSMLDTGKPVVEILKNPADKHNDTPGVVALVEQLSDNAFKSSSYLYESLIDERTKGSGDAEKAAFSLAFKTDMSFFSWIELPENAYAVNRFARSMHVVDSMSYDEHAVLEGLGWDRLSAGSTIVDVGGGVGSQALVFSKAFPHLDFVIQDQPKTLAAADEFWKEKSPEALSTGKVKLQAHNFFEPQSLKNPAVFFMRFIMHDWSDEACLTILRHLRAAAAPDTQLVVVDAIIGYACPEPAIPDIEGTTSRVDAPAPLLPHIARSAPTDYLLDLTMMTLHNGLERTLVQFKRLFEESGWKITKVYQDRKFGPSSKIIGIPALS